MIRMRAISPVKFKNERYRQLAIGGMNDVSHGSYGDFQKTMATWKRKAPFERRISMGPGFIRSTVATDDEIYRSLNDGTEPRPIFPVRAKALRFRGTYTAKTTPGVIGSKSGGASGDVVFVAYVKRHPGIKARGFSTAIAKAWNPRFRRRMEKVMSQFRKECGHEI